MYQRFARHAASIAQFASFSIVQFALSLAISTLLPVEEIALVSFATLAAIFFSGLVRAALLPAMINAESLHIAPPATIWSVPIVLACTIGGALMVVASLATHLTAAPVSAQGLLLAALLMATMPAYDLSRRGYPQPPGTFFRTLTFFSLTTLAAALLMQQFSFFQTALAAITFTTASYILASHHLFHDALSTKPNRQQWRFIWRTGKSSITHSPTIALSSGLILQGAPIIAGIVGGPAILAGYYIIRVLALPIWTILNATDAMQKRFLNQHPTQPWHALVKSCGAQLVLLVTYSLILLLALPLLHHYLNGGFTLITPAIIILWALVLGTQTLSNSLDNLAYTRNQAAYIAFGKSVGALTTLGLLPLLPLNVETLLISITMGYLTSAAITGILLLRKHHTAPQQFME